MSLFVPYAYSSLESIDFIRLSLSELNAILLNSSVNTLDFLLLNLCNKLCHYFLPDSFLLIQLLL